MDSLFTQLDHDWDQLTRDPRTVEGLRVACDLAGVESPTDLVPAVRSAAPDRADQVLLHLATRSSSDDLAARALLQALLPGTCRLAARWWALGDAEERAACAVAAVYARIRCYPVKRRPQRIAANVLLDAGQDLWRSAKRVTREAQNTVAVDPALMPVGRTVPEPTAAEELTVLVVDAVAAGVIGAQDAELILATRVGNDALPAMAHRRGAKLRTLQWRRQVAEAALAARGEVA